MNESVTAIVPAAGMGKRFNINKRKTFVEIDGIPLIIHTLKRLNESGCIREVIPVLMHDDIEKGYNLIAEHGLKKIKRIVEGGKERQDSVYNGLKAIGDDGIVLIHDGARPIIPDGLIEALINEIDGLDGVIPGIPLKETIKTVDDSGTVIETLNREGLLSIQTPQVFCLDVLRRAYQDAYKDGYYGTDDAVLVERIGGRVKVIMGSPYNIKVTTQEDIEIVRSLMRRNAVQ
ncbi:MAG: 2-C-methyl-D-erythritol 4-phosphate cytidylyltransferase [Thermodesulfovibrionia bacterium]